MSEDDLYLPFTITSITLDTDEGTKVVKRREVFVTKDSDGNKMVTSFGATLADVASALRHNGWTVTAPNEGPPNDPAHTLGAERKGRTRTGDHTTSAAGARDVALRAGTQAHRLLVAYEIHSSVGLTDEEAAGRAELLGSCYWKRCGELREDALIETIPGTGHDGVRTRVGSAGTARIVCRITDAGRAVLSKAAL
ncbi:MAG: hypothetical protein ACOH10_12880 [Rhodoglobus sp.]